MQQMHSSSTNGRAHNKQNLIAVSGSKRNNARVGAKSSAGVRVRKFAWGAGEKRAESVHSKVLLQQIQGAQTIMAQGGLTLKSTNTLSGDTFARCFRRRCDRQRSGSSPQREGRVAGGNLDSTSGACEARRQSRNGPIFSIQIMYRWSRGRATTQGNETFLWERREGESPVHSQVCFFTKDLPGFSAGHQLYQFFVTEKTLPHIELVQKHSHLIRRKVSKIHIETSLQER